MKKKQKRNIKVEMIRHEIEKVDLNVKDLQTMVNRYIRTKEGHIWELNSIKKILNGFVNYIKENS